ncbi:MAG: hypothetical protein LBH93_05480 [Chitinispirillales bacterium]|jgi:hypothetical protein|nr:hypothetical protein [Chitinispirillales bacterium]
MDALKTITQRIEDGFVMSEDGRWVYMAEQRIYEKRVIEQISNGNVLVDGDWVAIGEARRRSKPKAPPTLKAALEASAQNAPLPAFAAPHVSPQSEAASFEAVENMLETVCIDASTLNIGAGANDFSGGGWADSQSPAAHIDSVLLLGLSSASSASKQSKYAMDYIEELNDARKRRGLFGKLAALSIALAIAAAAALVAIQRLD